MYKMFSLRQYILFSKVYDDKERTRLIGKYCGSKVPFSIVTSSNELALEYNSNSTSAKGFSANYVTSKTGN